MPTPDGHNPSAWTKYAAKLHKKNGMRKFFIQKTQKNAKRIRRHRARSAHLEMNRSNSEKSKKGLATCDFHANIAHPEQAQMVKMTCKSC